jgi:uncharacterized repeat protein (TIGR01451 family)
MRLPSLFVLLALLGCSSVSLASPPEATPLWTEVPAAQRDGSLANAAYRHLDLDRDALRTMQAALRAGGRLALPLPEGGLATFDVADSGTMPAELVAKYPEIVSLSGRDAQGRRARIDISPAGLHAMVFGDDGVWVVQPADFDATRYYSFAREHYVGAREPFQCDVHTPADGKSLDSGQSPAFAPPKLTTGSTLRTYRIAIAGTGEYTTRVCQPNTSAVACGLAAIVTSLNRVNGVYENDLAVRLTLVPNNDLLVYTNGATDPYTNNDGGTMLGQNQTNITNVIGSANYDVGHVFSTGGGGVAGLAVTCVNGSKARGVTGQGTPLGDPFDIDYVAHEVGHQFGGNHTFNGNASACNGNRVGSAAYEPGSGSTIMAYAGICGAQDIQPNSDPYFHARSLEEIAANIGNDTCEVETATGNAAPVITPLTGRTIPARTPFLLTGAATDTAGQNLTYGWEQWDLGTTQTTNTPNPAVLYPLFRSENPTTDPSRMFPRLERVLGLPSDANEVLPTTNWPAGTPMTFRLTVRDNAASGGGTQSADVNLTVSDSGSAFAVTAPSVAGTDWVCGESRSVTWNVAGTAAAPVSCSDVALDLSTDGGVVFDRALGTVPNNGSANVIVPFATTNEARVRARCASNIFFNINPVDFDVIDGGATDAVDDTLAARLEDATAFSITAASLTGNDVRGSAGDVFAVQNAIGGSAVLSGGNVEFTPATDFNGQAGFDYILRDDCDRGPARDTTAEVRFPVTAVNDAPSLALDGDVDLPAGAPLTASVPAFAEVTSFGPADEAGQGVLEYLVTILDDADDVLVSASIAPNGTLSYELTGNGGDATLAVRARDDGGTANGGVDLSVAQTFVLSAQSIADLRVSKGNGSDGVLAGATTVYTVVFANDGAIAVDDVVIADPLPSGLTGASWTCVANGATCPAASGSGGIAATVDLPAGSSLTFSLTATVSAAVGATIQNQAEITAPVGIDEATLSNNIAIDADQVFGTLDLVASIDDGQTDVFTGDRLSYTVVFSNIGTSQADDATLTALVPAGLTDVEWTCVGSDAACPIDQGTGNIALSADLPAASALTFTVEATVVAAPDSSIAFEAEIASAAAQPELVTGNNAATDSDDVALGIDLVVSKDNAATALVAGEVANYVIGFENAGGRDAAAVRVLDALPATLDAATATWTCSGDGASCPAAQGSGSLDFIVALPAGSGIEFSLTAAVLATSGETVTNAASAALDGGAFEFDIANNLATDADPVLDAAIFDDGFEPLPD